MLSCDAARAEKCAGKGAFPVASHLWPGVSSPGLRVKPHVQGLNEDSGGRCFDQCLAKSKCSKAAVLLLLVLLEVVNCLAF